MGTGGDGFEFEFEFNTSSCETECLKAQMRMYIIQSPRQQS